jgi:hypothetical protein
MHCILTSTSNAPTYVSASASHLQGVKVLHKLDNTNHNATSQYKSQHWTCSNIIQGTLNLYWIIRIQKQDCHEFITNIYVILKKLLTFYT